jgi:flagellar hook-basal body complex protein FliE
MTIPAIGAISAALPVLPTSATANVNPTPSGSGDSFAAQLSKGLNAVQDAQSKADGLAVQAATGDLTDVHNYTIAATQASLLTELATTIRTKGVDAFNQIMGMQA